MAHRRTFPGRVASTKRLTSWFFFTPVEVTFTAGGGTLIFSLNAAALALRPFTIVRSHFLAMIRSDQAAAIERQVGAWGMAVVSDQATAVGVTAIPTPITDMGSDLWFTYQSLMAHHQEITDRSEPVEIYKTDSKAMRKVDIGQDLVVVGELASGQSAGFILNLMGRMLVKVN